MEADQNPLVEEKYLLKRQNRAMMLSGSAWHI